MKTCRMHRCTSNMSALLSIDCLHVISNPAGLPRASSEFCPRGFTENLVNGHLSAQAQMQNWGGTDWLMTKVHVAVYTKLYISVFNGAMVTVVDVLISAIKHNTQSLIHPFQATMLVAPPLGLSVTATSCARKCLVSVLVHHYCTRWKVSMCYTARVKYIWYNV